MYNNIMANVCETSCFNACAGPHQDFTCPCINSITRHTTFNGHGERNFHLTSKHQSIEMMSSDRAHVTSLPFNFNPRALRNMQTLLLPFRNSIKTRSQRNSIPIRGSAITNQSLKRHLWELLAFHLLLSGSGALQIPLWRLFQNQSLRY